MRSSRFTVAALCVVLAGLEVLHPATAQDAQQQVWIGVHVALLVGYALLCVALWTSAPNALARASVAVFGVLNAAFLAIEGLGVGAPMLLLANVTGAAWSAALLTRVRESRVLTVLLAAAWVLFVAGAFGLPVIVSRVAAIGVMAWLVYTGGRAAIGGALLAFAAVLRQHVGPEAALGLLCVAAAITAE